MSQILRELTQLWGPSGDEREVSDYIVGKMLDYCDEAIRDAVGNLILLKKGNGEEKKKIMCAAHTDEIGLCVMGVTDKGYLRVRNIGGVGSRLLQNTRVIFKDGTIGIVSTNKELDEQKVGLEHIFVDIGASTKEEALKLVGIGEKAIFVGEYLELENERVVAKAIDDRIGCYILMEVLKEMGTPYHDIYFAFTVQEELGLIGSTVAAERIEPDLGIAVDITGAFDTPDGKFGNMELGKGTAIKAMDNSVMCDVDIVEDMISCAIEGGILYQIDMLSAGGTDAGAIKKGAKGAKAAGISLPTRYGHGPCSMCSMIDVNASIDLLKRYLVNKISLENVIRYK